MTAGGVLDRFPDLRTVFLEANGGWIVPWLERLDHHFEIYSWDVPWLKEPPSEIFRRQCWISFDPDESTLPFTARSPLVGADRIVWASDFPHPDAKYPGTTDDAGRGDRRAARTRTRPGSPAATRPSSTGSTCRSDGERAGGVRASCSRPAGPVVSANNASHPPGRRGSRRIRGRSRAWRGTDGWSTRVPGDPRRVGPLRATRRSAAAHRGADRRVAGQRGRLAGRAAGQPGPAVRAARRRCSPRPSRRSGRSRGLRSALWSVFEPGTELPEHTGPNAGMLRYHLGVRCGDDAAVRVGDVVVPYRDGEGVLFDDTVPHAAWNRGAEPIGSRCSARSSGRCRPAAAWANRAVQSLISLDPRYRECPGTSSRVAPPAQPD